MASYFLSHKDSSVLAHQKGLGAIDDWKGLQENVWEIPHNQHGLII